MPTERQSEGRERHTNEQYEEAGDLQFGSASDEAEAAGHNGDICPRPTTTHGADPDAKIGRFLLFVGIGRGDGAKEPFRLGKRFFLSMLFLSKKRKSIGPAQRPRPLGKKEKRHPRSLRFVSQRRLRRNLRRLASQRRLPGGFPADGRRIVRPYEHDPTSEHECRGADCCSRFFADRPGGMLIPPAPRPSPPWWARGTARCG